VLLLLFAKSAHAHTRSRCEPTVEPASLPNLSEVNLMVAKFKYPFDRFVTKQGQAFALWLSEA
jgi:hypothetical protein